MDTLTFKSQLKASGTDYKNIVFWNRFFKNPTELILTWVPAALTIVALVNGFLSGFLAIVYAICWFYPIFIFAYQFPTSIKYHLEHRPKTEDMLCTFELSEEGVKITSDETDENGAPAVNEYFEWKTFTASYLKSGYYMFFEGNKMLVMMKEADFPAGKKADFVKFFRDHADGNKCRFYY